MTFGPNNTLQAFLPTNLTFSKNEEEFNIQITTRMRDVARYLNLREIAIFDLTEVPVGQQWFNPANTQIKRDGFRQVYNVTPTTPILAGATSTTPHGITQVSTLNFTHIYGTCITVNPDFRPMPYASVTAANQGIELLVDATNFYIINGAAAPNITSAIVVLEYLKN